MLNSIDSQRKHPRKQFSQEEDADLIRFVESYRGTEIKWKEISLKMKDRSIRQCKERWEKYLNPSLSVDPWTPEEDDVIINMFYEFGPKWTLISNMLENRTDIMVRNRWNVINRKVLKTHKKKNKDKKNKNTRKTKNKKSQINEKQIDSNKDKKAHVQVEEKKDSFKLFNETFNQFDMNDIDQFIEVNDVVDFNMFF
ncbi:hypothetical protein M9Y10_038139 [Tritrichomonas musculus]|uniref:Myb-like DNA-binding domain containing protein n=1 Tax=Tritrichomonas musculus TaxID=1915356 RepID=A0ABR2K9E9_9EUKA